MGCKKCVPFCADNCNLIMLSLQRGKHISGGFHTYRLFSPVQLCWWAGGRGGFPLTMLGLISQAKCQANQNPQTKSHDRAVTHSLVTNHSLLFECRERITCFLPGRVMSFKMDHCICIFLGHISNKDNWAKWHPWNHNLVKNVFFHIMRRKSEKEMGAHMEHISQ